MKGTLIAIALAVIMLLPMVSAAEVIGSECSSGLILDTKVHEACHQQTNFNVWAQTLADSSDFLMKNAKDSTAGYKDVGGEASKFENTKSGVNKVANALIILAITYAGTIYVVSGTDPKKRFEAKRQLIAFVYMIIFANAAFYLAGLAYDLSQGSATMIESNTDEFMEADPWNDIVNDDAGGEDALQASYNKFSSVAVVTPIMLVTGWSYVLLMYLRNMVVILLTVLAPMVVVLFFFEPTKSFGKVLAILYAVELFLPALFFPVFEVAGNLLGSDPQINIGIIASALAVAVMLHLVLVGVTIIKSAEFGVREEE